MFERAVGKVLEERLSEPRRFIHLLCGPRQVGKTTLIRQVLARHPGPSIYAAADGISQQGTGWLAEQWELARIELRRRAASRRGHRGGGGGPETLAAGPRRGGVLVLDEIQKIPGWSEVVKRLWDEDSRNGVPLQVVLLGSAPLLVDRGAGESLTGRFERIPMGHWSFPEMNKAFGWDLPTFLFFGGYPGAASLIGDPRRWADYIRDSLIESTLSKDILEMARIDKPALLRRLFHLACSMAGQVVSYQKMVGQLQDVGNTTTLAHYLDLLEKAGLVAGLEKWSGRVIRRRGSSPKVLPLNTALMSAVSGRSPSQAESEPDWWGRLVETAVGAYLWREAGSAGFSLSYWRERDREVDFVLDHGQRTLAIEVKSGRHRGSFPGMGKFVALNPGTVRLLVGSDGIPLQEFLSIPPTEFF